MNSISYTRRPCAASPCPVLLAITLACAGCDGDGGTQCDMPALVPPVDASSEIFDASFGPDSGLVDAAIEGGSGDAATDPEQVDGG